MRPCQQCGTALESNVSECPECGREQVASVGLDAPRPPRRKGGQPTPELPTGSSPSFRLAFGLTFIAGLIVLTLAASYVGWLMFGTPGALIAAIIAVATIGSILSP